MTDKTQTPRVTFSCGMHAVEQAKGEAHCPYCKLSAVETRGPDADLVERCREIMQWQSEGVLSGMKLREFAKTLQAPEHTQLMLAEKMTANEAMNYVLLAAAQEPRIPGYSTGTWGGPTDAAGRDTK